MTTPIIKVPIPKDELIQVMIEYLRGQGYINDFAVQHFSEMSMHGKKVTFEFVLPDVENTDEEQNKPKGQNP